MVLLPFIIFTTIYALCFLIAWWLAERHETTTRSEIIKSITSPSQKIPRPYLFGYWFGYMNILVPINSIAIYMYDDVILSRVLHKLAPNDELSFYITLIQVITGFMILKRNKYAFLFAIFINISSIFVVFSIFYLRNRWRELPSSPNIIAYEYFMTCTKPNAFIWPIMRPR